MFKSDHRPRTHRLRDTENNISQNLQWGRYTLGYPPGANFYTMLEILSKPISLTNMNFLAIIISEILKVFEQWGPELPLGVTVGGQK